MELKICFPTLNFYTFFFCIVKSTFSTVYIQIIYIYPFSKFEKTSVAKLCAMTCLTSNSRILEVIAGNYCDQQWPSKLIPLRHVLPSLPVYFSQTTCYTLSKLELPLCLNSGISSIGFNQVLFIQTTLRSIKDTYQKSRI